MRENLWLYVMPIFFVSIFAGGPLAEDIGWRGYILPKLREGMSAFTASLVIGVVWLIWHVPFFIFPEGASIVAYIPFSWFAVITIGWSVLMAWVYVNTQSILMPVLFHAAINTTLGVLGLLGGEQGFGWPLYLYAALTWVVVGIVVWVFGTDLIRKPDAAPQGQLASA
jgi:membrane protease YdiL (CAAX protease family)